MCVFDPHSQTISAQMQISMESPTGVQSSTYYTPKQNVPPPHQFSIANSSSSRGMALGDSPHSMQYHQEWYN